MINPKELRMSVRRVNKKVNFDSTSDPETRTSVMFEAAAQWIRSGDLESVRESLKNRTLNPDERDETGQTLLMLACQSGQTSLADDLIRHQWDVNAEDNDGWTALHNAAKEGFYEIVTLLINNGATVDARDGTGWTALMWSCYNGDSTIVRFLIDSGAFVNMHDSYHMSGLIWAAGRGQQQVITELISHGAKVNAGDKFGTTALIWAARKGYSPIVEKLLEVGANVDTAGMFSWTALIVATKGNYVDIVGQLLEHKPNVNAVDADGYTALAICCKEGFTEIANRLLSAGAYVNMLDKGGDTNLIHAAKTGNLPVVDVLLKKHADIDIQGSDKKTALYWAVEKGHLDVVKTLLAANPNLELATKDGDTPLMRATRNRNIDVVNILLERKNPAKVSACDKRGDTALHIAMRARSKGICEVLLRNPKNGHILYRPNKTGETPYNIDAGQQKSILSQIFGARKLNTAEDNENMLGYDLYSSSLADILSEPSLTVPITVGLYARWGSGKSFLLNKLENEMRSFGFQWMEQGLKYTWVLFVFVCSYSVLFGYIIGLSTQMWIVALAVTGSSIILSYGGFYLMRYGSRHYDWNWAYDVGARLDELLTSLKLVLQVLFCHPGNYHPKDGSIPVRFIFANQTKVSSSGDGGASIAYLMVSMYQALEEEFGYFTTRFYRAFRPKVANSATWTFRRLCCIPYFIVCILTMMCLMVTVELLISSTRAKRAQVEQDSNILVVLMISFASIVGVVFIANLYTWIKMAASLFMSYERSIHRYMARVDSSVQGGYSEALKSEVKVICGMIHCIDSFIAKQTRLVIIVDGLDSCEQTKVLCVLDAVNVMLSDPGMPFVIILAVDPHIVIKAVESNVSRVIQNPSLRGFDYLRNIVHLPFYLQNSGLRKVRAAAHSAALNRKTKDREDWDKEGLTSRRVSNCSAVEVKSKRTSTKGNHKLRSSESIASSIGNIHQRSGMTGGQDLTKVLLNDDYFSDINPRSMRRLMNILYVTGRLLRAFNIDFSWYHLASWVNITEQWPCHASWLILYSESHEPELEENTTLRSLFEKIRHNMPTSKEVESLLNMDHDVKKMEVCLSLNQQSLQVNNLRVFVPFAINLDPYIRRVLQDVYQAKLEQARPPTAGRKMGTTVPPTRAALQNTPWGMPPPPADGHFFMTQQQMQHAMPFMYYPPGQMIPHVQNMPQSLPPMFKPSRMSQERLSSLSVEGVCKLFAALEGLGRSNLQGYQDSLVKHNINGRVLLTCDLNELKAVLSMSFGDWEIFRMHILSMRTTEMNMIDSPDERDPLIQSLGSSDNTSADARTSMKVLEQAGGGSDKPHEREGSGKGHRKPPPSVSKNATSLEKQVTMEENMIMGALETLSEETLEDSATREIPTSGATSLSPIMSDEESPDSNQDSSDPCTALSTANNSRLQLPNVNDETPNVELDFVYIQKPSPNSRYSLNSLSTSVPEIEWGAGGGSTTSSGQLTAGQSQAGQGPIAGTTSHSLIAQGSSVLVSAPPSIASSPQATQPSVTFSQDSRGSQFRNKLLESVSAQEQKASPKTAKKSRDSAVKPPSSLTIDVTDMATEDEKKPLLSEMEPIELPLRSSLDSATADYRRQQFGRQYSVEERDTSGASGSSRVALLSDRPQKSSASVGRSKSLASGTRQEYEVERKFSHEMPQSETGGQGSGFKPAHSAQSAAQMRRSTLQKSHTAEDNLAKQDSLTTETSRSTSASTETVI